MDTSTDFIRPEFLNILFFQQKNLVIFPYVDLKHLHGLDMFTIGHNTIDLESTALHNLREFLEVEVNNSYSQTPDLYFIYNVDKDNLNKIIGLEDIRCIINTNENVRDLVNGSTYIFFNKKHNQFLNYNTPDSELGFEEYLISSSENEMILQDKIQQIKSMATKIFTEANKDSTLKNLPMILDGYDKKYWNSILKFTENYFKIKIPNVSHLYSSPSRRKKLQDFSQEYELIVSINKQIGKEFIQLLHEYRGKKVNPSNLELEELFNPQKLYTYLRNHHWKEGIPHEFIDEWYKMELSQYTLNEADQTDFETILKKLGVHYDLPRESNSVSLPVRDTIIEPMIETISSPRNEWDAYKQSIRSYVDKFSYFIDKTSMMSNSQLNSIFTSNIIKEILELERIFDLKKDNRHEETQNGRSSELLEDKIKQEISIALDEMNIRNWIDLYKIKEKFTFVVRFITELETFHDEKIGKDDNKVMPIKIKELHFPLGLEKKLLSFNRNIRNKITHDKMLPDAIEPFLETKNEFITETYFHLLCYFIKSKVISIINRNYQIETDIYNWILTSYFKKEIFLAHEIDILQNILHQLILPLS